MPNAQCPGLCVQSPCWRSDRWFPTLCTGQLYDFFKHLKSIVGFSLLTLSMCVAGEDTRLELTSTQVEYSVDLGVFRANETIVKRLTFVNNSLSPLTPSGVKASCGCIVAKVPAKAISPAGTISFAETKASNTIVPQYSLVIRRSDRRSRQLKLLGNQFLA